MEQHRYPATSLLPDYLRVAFGLAATIGPLVALDLARPVVLVLSGLTLLFAWFGIRTALRQLSWVELSTTDIALCGPLRRRLPWQQLRRLQLAYYAPRRARRDGWLQLTLRGQHGRAIRVDSTLEGFEKLLRRAAGVAARNDLRLDPTTQANLAALGLATGPARALRPTRPDPDSSGGRPASAPP
jgi:hypothetical protein